MTPIVCRLSRTAAIAGADRIIRAEASGQTVIVGADRRDGDLGVYFSGGGALDRRFPEAAGLAKLKAGRVKEIVLRGVRSEGLWLPWGDFAEALKAWSPAACDAAARELWGDGKPTARPDFEGPLELADELGRPLFGKYMPRVKRAARPPRGYKVSGVGDAWSWYLPISAEIGCGGGPYGSEQAAIDAAWSHARPKRAKDPAVADAFPELYSTEALFRDASHIPLGSTCIATYKIHGESFRLGLVAPDGGVEGLRGEGPCSERDGVWVGTRRMDFGPADELPALGSQLGYLHGLRDLWGARLRPGEVIYGEVAGWRTNGAPVMKVAPGSRVAGHAYGALVTFTYGCAQGGPAPDGGGYRPGDMWRPFVYRITDRGRELTRAEIVARCAELLMEPVPPAFFADGRPGVWVHKDVGETRDRARLLAEGERGDLPDPLDPRHPLEGVCVRWERSAPGVVEVGRAMKAKSYLFRALEGLLKDDGRLEREEAEALGLDPDADGEVQP